MTPEPGVFESFYAGSIQHPLLLWIAALLGVAVCLGRRKLSPILRRYCVVLTLLSLADAWLTSNDIPGLGALPSSLAGVVPLFFVLAGDLRFLLIVTGGTGDGNLELRGRNLAAAAALTLVVPLSTQLVLMMLPAQLDRPRVMFLIYELAFVGLTLMLIRWSSRVRTIHWLRRLCYFVVLYYGLWVLADAIILVGGWDVGYLIRVVPNLLYYGGLIAAIALLAPSGRESGLQP